MRSASWFTERVGAVRREPNAEVIREASREQFLRILYDAVSRT